MVVDLLRLTGAAPLLARMPEAPNSFLSFHRHAPDHRVTGGEEPGRSGITVPELGIAVRLPCPFQGHTARLRTVTPIPDGSVRPQNGSPCAPSGSTPPPVPRRLRFRDIRPPTRPPPTDRASPDQPARHPTRKDWLGTRGNPSPLNMYFRATTIPRPAGRPAILSQLHPSIGGENSTSRPNLDRETGYIHPSIVHHSKCNL